MGFHSHNIVRMISDPDNFRFLTATCITVFTGHNIGNLSGIDITTTCTCITMQRKPIQTIYSMPVTILYIVYICLTLGLLTIEVCPCYRA